jgi:UDP-N-acetylglucosamine transferase subunit ALG13
MDRLLTSAQIVITHGGPATIAEARAAGRIPIVVPRRVAYGEHVDDHQLAYARWLAAVGEVLLVEDVSQLTTTVQRYEYRTRALPPAATHDSAPAATAFGVVISRLLNSGQT